MRPFWRILGRFAFALGAGSAVLGQTPVFEPAPTAMTNSVDVAEGGRVDIRLGTTGAPAGKTLDIQIRLRPTKGRLEQVQASVAGDGGTVVYTHIPSQGAGYDTFSYTVQRPGGPVSPPANVTIRIAETPAHLAVAMTQLDFGAMNPGDVGARQSLVLVNLGGGVAEGAVLPPPPWRVEGSVTYRLRRGERQSFTLVFQPTGAGVFNGELRFGPRPNQSVLLSGVGLASTRIEPGAIPPSPPPNATPGQGTTKGTPSPEEAGRSGPGDEDESEAALPGGPANVTEWFPREAGGESPIARVEVLAADDGTIFLRWPVPTPVPVAYRIETRARVVRDQRLEVLWIPVPSSLQVEPGQTAILARIGPLAGGRSHCLRVVALSEEGQTRGYSAGLDVAVRAAPFAWAKWMTGLILLALAALAAFAPRRRPSFPSGKG